MVKFIKFLGLLARWLVLLAGITWGSAALWFDGPASRPVAATLAAAFALAALALLVMVKPRRRANNFFLVLFIVVLGWWFSLAPSNQRNWQPDVARLPAVVFQGNKVTIRNVRNFEYRSETDFTERWETRTYDLTRLRGLDLFVSYWGSPYIAHTFLSWDFDDGKHLVISIETRKEVGESYSAVRGFFRQYELYYVVGDERDIAGVRTHYRNEDVYLYRLRMSRPRARALLLDYLTSINDLAARPEWYNALRHNCTTTILLHAGKVIQGIPHDWRWLANGYLDELLYKERAINRDLPFEELKSRSYISPKARAVPLDGQFSGVIREGLPARPTHPAP